MGFSFETVGAALGFVATAILLWDRLIKNRPYARLSAKPFLNLPGAEATLYVDVVNPSRYPIIVRPEYDDGGLRPALGSDRRSVIYASTGTAFERAIDAEGSYPFTVFTPSGFAALADDEMVRLRFRWWPAQTWWAKHPGWRLTIRISKDRLDAMLHPSRHEDGD